MKISKKKALKLLENDILFSQRLPIYNKLIFFLKDGKLETYTSRELMKIIYDFEDKK